MFINRASRGIRWIFLLIILINGFSVTPAQGLKTGEVPTLKSPYGYIIDSTPSFKWTAVGWATNYQLQLYMGTTLVYTKTWGNSFCVDNICTRTPSEVLELGAYKWRMRAKIDNVWKAWSGYKTFTLIPPSVSFNSQFNGDKLGWTKKAGAAWLLTDTYLYTAGSTTDWTSIYRSTGEYDNFIYQARIKRTSSSLMNYLCVRMGNSLSSDKKWYPGYWFGFDNSGRYSIFRADSATSIIPILYNIDSDDIVPYDWNIIKVRVAGDYFEFYINGILQYYFHDDTYDKGLVGFMMKQVGIVDNEFQVDWAKLQVIYPP